MTITLKPRKPWLPFNAVSAASAISAVCILLTASASASNTHDTAQSRVVPNNVATDTLNYQLRGNATQGGMLFGKTDPDAKVQLNNKTVRVAPDGQFVIGFGRDAAPKATLTITLANGESLRHTLAIKQRQYNIQKIEGVPSKTVTPSQEFLKRIRKESSQVGRARKTDSDKLFFLERFDWPLMGRITGVYGSQRYYNGVPKRPHFGLDIAAPTGTPMYAPNDGTITLAHPDMFYSGGTIIMDHGYGISSTFIHLSKVHVKVGDHVKRGDLLGEVGAGGRATGPHLDWRINWYKVRLDPQLIMGSMPSP